MKKFLVFTMMFLLVISASLFVGCQKVDFKLNFVVDGKVYSTITTNGNEIIKLPDNPEKEGYVFDGWYFDNEVWKKPFTVNSFLDAPLSSDMSVYAKFDGKKEEKAIQGTQAEFIGFTDVGGNRYIKKVSNDTEFLSLGTSVKVSLTSSWILSFDIYGNNTIASKTATLSVGDNTYYVSVIADDGTMQLYTLNIRRREIYTVSFADCDANAQYVEEDSCATAPASANRNGYTFASWDFDFSTPIIENTVVNAKWNVVTYNIEYDLNGGENNPQNPIVYTTESDIVLETPTMTDYDFIGWYIDDAFTQQVEKMGAGMFGNKKLYAKWASKLYLFDESKGKITGLTDYGKTCTELIIPGKINKTIVTSIGHSAFSFCTSLKSITIPDSMTSIDINAFCRCKSLTGVYITDIAKWCAISFGGEDANPLYYANKLYLNGTLVTDLVIPDGVTSIGSYAFRGCDNLTGVYITDIAKWCAISFGGYDDNPLYYANKLYLNGILVTDLVILDGVTSIGFYAFYGCTSLTSITIPNSVTSIGFYAFYGCTSLTSITTPNSVTSIDNHAFDGCVKLVEVINNSNLDITKGSSDNGYIGYYAFSVKKGGTTDIINKNGYLFITVDNINYMISCTSNSSEITLPANYNGEQYQIYGTFLGCTNLTSVTIPDSVTSIGSYAFQNCSSLTNVTIGNSVTSIGDYAFWNCTNLTSIIIPNSVTSIGSDAFNGCTNLTNVTIGNNVTSIGNGAFWNCTNLTNITIPNSVSSIGSYAFGFGRGNSCYIKNYNEYDNAYYLGNDTNKYLVLIKAVSTEIENCKINDNCKIIYDGAFNGCDNLTGVYITDIAKWCAISFGSYNSNPLGYADKLYLNGTLVKDLVIPDSVTSIGSYAFQNCSSLTNVTIGNYEQRNNNKS